MTQNHTCFLYDQKRAKTVFKNSCIIFYFFQTKMLIILNFLIVLLFRPLTVEINAEHTNPSLLQPMLRSIVVVALTRLCRVQLLKVRGNKAGLCFGVSVILGEAEWAGSVHPGKETGKQVMSSTVIWWDITEKMEPHYPQTIMVFHFPVQVDISLLSLSQNRSQNSTKSSASN